MHDYTFIKTPEALSDFVETHRRTPWIGFDTEFIGERRYHTLLCLIQVSSPQGLFLIDPLSIRDLSPFEQLLISPDIMKITHSGENDYRLFFRKSGLTPRNVFDTQMAAGFVGYAYPVGFDKLLKAELGVHLNKSYSVTDWKARPMNEQQLRYALDDVIYLRDLWAKLDAKLRKSGRLDWAKEEFAIYESPSMYEVNPDKEILSSNLMRRYGRKDRLFLMRLLRWRDREARRKNHSREMVLSKKVIPDVVKAMRSGGDALAQNRRLSPSLLKKYSHIFRELAAQPVRPEEEKLLKQIPDSTSAHPRYELVLELLYLLVQFKCQEAGISAALAMPRQVVRALKEDSSYRAPILSSGWRRKFLGGDLLDWLSRVDSLEVRFLQDKIEILKEGEGAG